MTNMFCNLTCYAIIMLILTYHMYLENKSIGKIQIINTIYYKKHLKLSILSLNLHSIILPFYYY